MIKKTVFLLIFFCLPIFAQNDLNYFINKALENSPNVYNYEKLGLINKLQYQFEEAQNSAFQIYLTGNYLFAPYFNNDGHLVTINPLPKAIGYDVGITNGGNYSALLNIDKNIFNGGLINALQRQRNVQGKSYENRTDEEKHNLTKQVIDQYLNTYEQLQLYDISKEIVGNLANQLKITGDLVTRGIAKVHDYMLLKVETQSQRINLDQSWQNYKDGLYQLYSLCGIKDTQNVILDTVNLKLTSPPEHSSFLTQYYLDSLSAASQQNVFETKYLPQVKLFFNTGLNATEIDQIQRRFGLSAGIDFSMPILDGGQTDITRQQTIISEKIAGDYKKYAAKNIYLQRKNASDKIKSLRKNLGDYEDQIGEYKKLLNISLSQLQRGNLSMIEYLTELRNYIDLQKNYIFTKINYQLEINNYNYWNW
jgi:outer membrane protein TolC